MYKSILSGVALMMSLMASAQYNSLKFNTADGQSCLVDVTGLTISISGQDMVVTNSNGDSWTSSFASLVSMEFVTDQAGVSDLSTEIASSFTIYNLEGVELGKYVSLEQANANLPSGVYLLKKNDGETIKIAIGK